MNSTPANDPAPVRATRRAADRLSYALPMAVDGAPGLTRNVSATGVYFETTVDKPPGSKVRFIVEVTVKGEALKMVCSGEVMRVEHKVSTVGIAVKLSSSFFTDTDSSEDAEDHLDD